MKPGETFIAMDFALTPASVEWTEQKYPTVDVGETLEIFRDKAAALGWSYRDWQAAWRNYIRNGQRFGGVAYRQGRAADPRWTPILEMARPYGFRAPLEHETPASYRTAFEQWKNGARPAVNVAAVLKRVK